MAVLEQGIRILVIEDNTGDFVLIEEYLLEETKKPEIERAVTLSDVNDILARSDPYDVILLDLSLPDASGESLVEEVVSLVQETPIIVLTGYESRDFELKTLGMGISDYLLKDELNPILLSKSISYSMERNRINRSLRESEKQYRDLFDLSPLPKWVYDLETMEFLDVNHTAIKHYGYSREEFLAMTIEDIRPENELPALEKSKKKFADAKGPHHIGLFIHRKKNGELIKVEIQSSKIDYYERPAKMVVSQDVTEQKENEAELVDLNKKLSTAQQIAKLGYWQLNIKTRELYWSDEVYRIWECDPNTFQPNLENLLSTIHPDDRDSFIRNHQLSLDGQVDHNVTHRILIPDGTVKWVQERGTLSEIGNDGEPVVFEGTVQDITEKVENEQKLQESLERYEYVTKATDEVIYDWDIEADEIKWDDSFYAKFSSGSKNEHYSTEDWSKNLHPEDKDKGLKNLYETLADPASNKWELEYRFRKSNGNYAIVFERGFILRDQKGKAIRMIGSLQDITERKEHENKLKELSLVAAKTTDIIIMTDSEERITWVNSAFEKLTGYTFEEALGKNPGELLQGPDTDPNTVGHLAKAMENYESVQAVILNYTKHGEPYWLDLTIDPIFDEEGNCEAFIAIEKDVTEQIERQKKLRESVDRYETVSKATSDTIWDLDLINDTTLYNENITNVFGYEKQKVDEPWQWWKSKIHPEDRPQVVTTIEKALESRNERVQFEYRFKATDGTYKNVYDRAFIVNNDNGKPIRIIGAMQDVTRQKEEEQWLRLFKSAITTTTEAVTILEGEPNDKLGRKILFVNDAFEVITGYSRNGVLVKTLNLLKGPKTSMKQINRLSEAMQQWKRCETEIINYKKNGEEFWINISMATVKDADGDYNHWICIGRDITERKQREVMLKESLKEKETLLMEIHHRVKNNLAVVSGMMQLQALEEEDENLRQKLTDSIGRIKTMASIHELLYQSESFSKLEADKNIKKLVSEIVNTFQTEVKLEISFALQPISININQAIPLSLIVNEVITNVLKHAFNEQEQGTLSVTMREKDNTIHIDIADNGKGLPPDFTKFESNNSLGMQLIETLSSQLKADYSYLTVEGETHFTLTFEKQMLKEPAIRFLLNGLQFLDKSFVDS